MNWRANHKQVWAQIFEWLKKGSALLLAAHPDDETIGASCLLSKFPESSVVFLTDGAPRDTSLWSSGANVSREEYANIRRQEAIRALRHAGVSKNRIYWLDAVDQEAAFEITRLARDFAKLLNRIGPSVIVTHPYEGGHPDHDSAPLVARIAVSQLGSSEQVLRVPDRAHDQVDDPARDRVQDKAQPILLEMTSYHARDGQCVTGEFLNSAALSEFVFELSEADRERKRRMANEYASQHLVLQNFPVDREPLRLAPDYDFCQPPHQGKLWYECMRWPMTGVRWRELAATALAEFQELSCR